MRTVLVAIALLGAQSLLAPHVAAAFVEDPRVSYSFHFFTDVDGVNVFTHYGGAGIKMDHKMALAFQWSNDTVVIPGIDAPPGSQEAVDAITTASRPITGSESAYEDFIKSRNDFQTTATFHGAKASYYVSTEEDYFAQMVTAGYNHDLMGDNLNLSGEVAYSWDRITPLDDADTATEDDYRITLHYNLVATQVVTPTTIIRLGAEYNHVTGLQHNPYRNVYVAGGNIREIHPRDRDRWDAFLRVSQYITNRSSIRVDYRYYDDDWGLSSHTIGGKLSQYVTDEVVVRYRYRYYTQVPAWFFADEYLQSGGVNGYRTGDYRLGDYGAHLFGGTLLWFPYGAVGHIGFLKGAHLSFTYEHYFNSNNFSANVYETGLRVSF